MRPFIFLDIDGVLNDRAFLLSLHQSGGQGNIFLVDDDAAAEHLDRSRIARLNALANTTGASIVLSTSWRCLFGPEATERMLRSMGLAAPVVGSTPRIYDVPRGEEIAVWLRNHPGAVYVVLDDEHDAGIGHDGRFVHVADGLEDEHVAAAVATLDQAGGR